MRRCVIVLLTLILLSACKTRTVYVPVESVRTEYREHYLRDSIFVSDSVIIQQRADTVYWQSFRYLYKDRIKTDTIALVDTLRIPYPVTEYKEINRLSSFQNFQVWCGRILLLTLFIGIGSGIFKSKLL